MKKDAVSVSDQRTGKTYEFPLVEGAVPAMAFREIKVEPDDFGMMTYDPAFMNTASCKSRITFIDGAKGILRYRGYPIEELAEKSSFLEVAYLLYEGELPTGDQLAAWSEEIVGASRLPEAFAGIYSGIPRDAHPMGVLMSSLSALGTYHHAEARNVRSPENRRKQSARIVGALPALAAGALRHLRGESLVEPDPSLSYTGNFLRLAFAEAGASYEPNPVLERALDVLFILHADHEQNCSTSVMRGAGSSNADPFASTAAASAALWGPLHGGANEAVLRMLDGIGSVDAVGAHIEKVKAGETRLMGFGHRVYKNYDPRAKFIKTLADQVFEVQGVNPRLEIARELERIALSDDYFVSRRLYPNVDFYSGLIYESLGFPSSFFTVLFAVGRAPGWLSQWNEFHGDEEQRIARPRQLYLGPDARSYPS